MRFFIIIAILFASAYADGRQEQNSYRQNRKYSDNVDRDGITLECDFAMVRHYWGEMYTCIPRNLVVDRYSEYVVNVTGDHMSGKTDFDVQCVYILGQRTRFLPYNISTPFNGLRAIRVEGSGLMYLNHTMRYEGPLEYLHFENNMLRTVPAWALKGLTNLRWLSLRGNQIRYLESTTLKDMPKLRRFSISNNLLEVIPSGLFHYTTEIEEVYFYNNNIRVIGARLIEGLPKLKVATFMGNKCTDVSIYDGADIRQRLGTEFTTKCGINCQKAAQAAEEEVKDLKREFGIKRDCSSHLNSINRQMGWTGGNQGQPAKSSESSGN